MSLIDILRKVYGKMRNLLSPEFNISVEEQKNIIDSYLEPKNDIERSFYQYQATMITNGKILKLLINCVSLFLCPYYILKLKRNYRILSNEKTIKCDAVFLSDGIIIETIPESVRREFPNIVLKKFTDSMCLSYEDIVYLKEIFKRYPVEFHFHLKAIFKLGMYSAQIIKHKPKAIISYTEGSFTSSIATAYCENYKIEHINIMHGERYFSIHLSFCRFSRYYVWDEYYIKLFKNLRAPVSQFIVELPEILNRNLDIKENPTYYLTYYLGDENKQVLLLIKKCFDKLKAQGKTCAIRIHPRWSDVDLVKYVFKDYYIEDAKIVTIKESLENTKYVASLRSTVLLEGYCNGKEVILDDVTQPHKYMMLKELGYIMMNKPHYLLSDILEGN